MSGYAVVATTTKGRGLFATKNFDIGEIILEEKPLISCQFSWNEAYQYLACENCLRPLETAEANVQRLAADKNINLPYPECCAVLPWLARHITCPNCGIKYCSEECRLDAFGRYHSTICQINSHPDRPITVLNEIWKKMHYPPETCSIMLLVKIFAMLKQTPNKHELVALFNDFQQKTSNEDLMIFHKLLGDQFVSQLEELFIYMTKIFNDPELSTWLTPDGFKSLFALIGTNGQGIGTSSIAEWTKNVGELNMNDSDRKTIDAFIDDCYMKMDEFSGSFLNSEGSGLYVNQSKINHSCNPNAEVSFPYSNFILNVTPLREIKVGEEICISYLDECLLGRSRHSRQKILKEHYLFECQCEKCRSEINNPDVTSDEEEYEDDDAMEN